MSTVAAADTYSIALGTLFVSISVYGVLRGLSWIIPPFDASHLISGSDTEPGLRWDALHFLGVARDGYAHEQQLAFQPGWLGTLAALGRVTGSFSVDTALRGAFAYNTIARIVANVFLYKITCRLRGRRAALLACALYMFPPAPSVLVAPYTEAPFAAFFFVALHLSLSGQYFFAALALAAATSIRSTGVLGALILAAHIVFRGSTGEAAWGTWLRRLPKAIGLALIIAAPLVSFQAYAYYSLCVPDPLRPWCAQRIPFSYSWIQRKYWNVGPFRYWTPQQAPNIALAVPVLYVSGRGCYTYLSSQLRRSLARSGVVGGLGAFLGQPATSIYVYQTIMLLLLTFASHTQIALRLSITDPVLWWTLADMIVGDGGKNGNGKSAKYWVYWCAIWGAVSLVLWAGHYPPA